jgi:uncharacterized protein
LENEMTHAKRSRYRVISADQHINEPPDLWTSRVPSALVDRVPYMRSFDEGDAWVIEGVADPINFGLNAVAGMRPEELVAWKRFDEIRRGGYDPSARVTEMDVDGIDAGLLFPTPRFSHGVTTNRDRELQLAMVRAYNDWISEYCEHAPDRLLGLALLPNTGVDDAIAEYHRVIDRPGIVGPLINCYPHGTTELLPEDDALWGLVAESGRPVAIHVTLTDRPPTANKSGLPGDMRIADVTTRMLQLMWSGVLDRFPELKVLFAEVDAGWVPFFKEQIDNRFHRLSRANQFGLERPPSEYFDAHYSYAFVTDMVAIQNRHAVGIKNMLWSDDYPHYGSDWPFTQRALTSAFTGIPTDERDDILAGNVARLYGLQGIPA